MIETIGEIFATGGIVTAILSFIGLVGIIVLYLCRDVWYFLKIYTSDKQPPKKILQMGPRTKTEDGFYKYHMGKMVTALIILTVIIFTVGLVSEVMLL